MENLTKKELDELMKHCSSVEKEIRLPDGRKKFIFKHRAILDRQGNPIEIGEYMIQSGERTMLVPREQVVKTPEEKAAIKKAVKGYKKHGSDKGFRSKFFQSKWLQRKIEELVLA